MRAFSIFRAIIASVAVSLAVTFTSVGVLDRTSERTLAEAPGSSGLRTRKQKGDPPGHPQQAVRAAYHACRQSLLKTE